VQIVLSRDVKHKIELAAEWADLPPSTKSGLAAEVKAVEIKAIPTEKT
jgi:hypothetical protein